MCEPSSIIMVIGMVMGAVAGKQQADAVKAETQYQAKVDEQNAKLEDYRAEQTSLIGHINEEKQRAKARQMVGSQRAALAANGVSLGEGTALDLIGDTYAQGEEDALNVRFNALQEAWGHQVNAVNFRNHGKFAIASGKNRAQGIYLSTAASMAQQGASMMGGMGGGGKSMASQGVNGSGKGIGGVTTINTGASYGSYS